MLYSAALSSLKIFFHLTGKWICPNILTKQGGILYLRIPLPDTFEYCCVLLAVASSRHGCRVDSVSANSLYLLMLTILYLYIANPSQ